MKPIYIFGRKKIRELEEELKATKRQEERLRNNQDILDNTIKELDHMKCDLQEEIYHLEQALSKTENELIGERMNVKTLEGVRARLLARIEELENNSKPARDAKGRFTKKK